MTNNNYYKPGVPCSAAPSNNELRICLYGFSYIPGRKYPEPLQAEVPDGTKDGGKDLGDEVVDADPSDKQE